jgi:hypothetical protein
MILAGALIAGPLLLGQLRSQQPVAPPSAPAAALAAGTSASAGNLVFSSQPIAGGRTQIVILDAANRSLASYSIEAETGMIELKSVRNIDADLRLKEFNGTKPSPDEVRAVLQP